MKCNIDHFSLGFDLWLGVGRCLQLGGVIVNRIKGGVISLLVRCGFTIDVDYFLIQTARLELVHSSITCGSPFGEKQSRTVHSLPYFSEG